MISLGLPQLRRAAMAAVMFAAAVSPPFAGQARAQAGCAVTEVAPGVKMRSAPCSSPFANPFAAAPQPRRPEAMPAGARDHRMRYGDTEFRFGGSTRFDYQGGRR